MTKTVGTEELKDMMDRGDEFVLVNILGREIYENEHICGSINIPVTRIGDATDLINRDETVIVYCSDHGCHASEMAAWELERLGFNDVRLYEGGTEAWKNSGYCVEGRFYDRFAQNAA